MMGCSYTSQGMPLSSFLSPRTFCALAVGSVLLLTTNLASAAAIVHWGNSTGYVTSSQNFNLPSATDNGSARTYQYSATNPITPSSSYSTPADRTGPIYAALQNINGTAAAASFGAASVADGDTATDFLRIQGSTPGAGNGDGNISGMFFFVKNNFLNNFNTGTLSLANVESFTSTISDYSGTSASFRLAVQNSGTWYLSATQATGAGTFSFSNVSSINYGIWDPTGAPLNTSIGAFTNAATTLTDVQAFGLYFDVTRTDNAPRFRVEEFQVVAIPEPTTWALLAGGLTCMMFFRRRKIA